MMANNLMQPLDAYRNSGLITADKNGFTSNSVLLDRSSTLSTYERNADQKSLKLNYDASVSVGRSTGN